MNAWIVLLSVTLGVATLCAAQNATELAKRFDYDHAAPVNIELAGTQQRGDVTIEDITYTGADGAKVPAYLVVPAGKGPFAVVLWGHWMMEGSTYKNRTEFLDEAVALAPSGVVSLLIDAPMVRANYKPQGDLKDDQQDIVDLRRGLDLLLARRDVDARRIAYVGHSFHAGTGAILAGVEPRFTALVLMAGGLDADRFLTSQAKVAIEVRQKHSPEEIKQHLAADVAINPKHYLQGKHAPLLLQFGTQDIFMTREDCQEYASVVSPPVEVKYYEAGHELNATARHDRIVWLQKELDLRSLNWKAMEAVPEIK